MMNNQNILSYKQKLSSIKMFVLDIDGVLTNGLVVVQTDGSLLRTMCVRDGYIIQKALTKGYQFGIISGGSNEGVRKRLEKLGITDIHLGVRDKLEVFNTLLDTYQIKRSAVLYMGDDFMDIACLEAAGLGCCPQDACPEVKAISDYISPFKGGEGCVRDVVYQTLKVSQQFD